MAFEKENKIMMYKMSKKEVKRIFDKMFAELDRMLEPEKPKKELITEENVEEFTEYGSYDVDYSDLDEELDNPDF